MKTINKGLSVVAFIAMAFLSISANAAQKIAIVDVQGVLRSLPQIADIEEKITAEFRDRRQEIQKLQSDGNFMVEKLQRESATMSEDEKAKLQQQIQQLSQELQTKAQPLQQQIQRRTNEEQQKLLGLIQQAINVIATRDGYDMILNSASVIYIKPEANTDISQQVLDQVSKAK